MRRLPNARRSAEHARLFVADEFVARHRRDDVTTVLKSSLDEGSLALSSHPNCAVLYIAFAPYGPEPFDAFISSYRRHRAGLSHAFYILCKGFAHVSEIHAFLRPAGEVPHVAIRMPDGGFDLGTYHHVASEIEADHLCFLNTRTVLLADDWLRMLHLHCSSERVGAAGATGSYESLFTDHVGSVAAGQRAGASLRSLVGRSFLNRWRHRYLFPPFPNPHLRTNAFMVRSTVFRRLRFGTVRSRLDTARLENGRRSITRQLAGMGLDTVVVGRDGRAYAPPDWRHSRTFWQGEQENLLVADNQTERYALADAAVRARLRAMAWGDEPR